MQNLFVEHIICVFPENIITRFDVSVNDVSKVFAEKLRIEILIHFEGKLLNLRPLPPQIYITNKMNFQPYKITVYAYKFPFNNWQNPTIDV